MNRDLKILVQVSLMAAIIFLAAFIIHVPTPGGVLHLGDCMVFVAAAILGRKKGAVSAAVGMALFDLMSGFALWAPFTFIIKGVMAYIAGYIIEKSRKESIKIQGIAFVAASVWMVAAYYFSQVLIGTMLTGEFISVSAAFIFALKDIPANIFQSVSGIIMSIPLIKALEKTLILNSK